MYRKSLLVFIITVLVLTFISSASAQSDWWLKENHKGEKNNTVQNVHVGDLIVFGQYNNKAMEWMVLEINENKALLFCTECLSEEPYNPVRSKFTTWEDCTLRKWLHDFYLSTAFSKTQRERIQLTLVDNSSEQHRDIYGKIRSQPDTNDYVYLLSWQEVTKYFPTEESRKKAMHWWTRSPGENPGAGLAVSSNGLMTYMNDASSNEEGVFPVLWLNLE